MADKKRAEEQRVGGGNPKSSGGGGGLGAKSRVSEDVAGKAQLRGQDPSPDDRRRGETAPKART